MTEQRFPEPDIPASLLSAYDPASTEKRVYELEMASGLFDPETSIKKGVTSKDAEAYTIVLPPPNVTGTLHLGHALGITIQDIMIRFHRMNGKKALWIPGTDHAAIATQAKVEKEISKIKKEMERAARDLDFMEAARLRDNMFAMQKQLESLKK